MTQEVGQLLQDMGDDVYQQYRSLTRQSSDFDTQPGFSINVSQLQPSICLLPFQYLLRDIGLCQGYFKGINFDVSINYLLPKNEDRVVPGIFFFLLGLEMFL